MMITKEIIIEAFKVYQGLSDNRLVIEIGGDQSPYMIDDLSDEGIETITTAFNMVIKFRGQE